MALEHASHNRAARREGYNADDKGVETRVGVFNSI